MADDLGQSKTEAPSPRRREEARQQGRVARSPELSGGLLLLAGVLALWLGSRTFGGTLLDGLRLDLGEIQKTSFGLDDAQGFFASLLSRGLGLLGSFLGMIFVVSLAAGLMQVGFNVSPEILALNWERLSPAAGFGRLFSLASVVRGAVAVLKLGAASLVVYWVIKGRSSQIASTGHESVAQVATVAWDIAMRLALAIAAALVTIGLVDYIFQRWRHEQSLMMSRQEKKDETKQDEGDPHVRARIRKLQRESARKRHVSRRAARFGRDHQSHPPGDCLALRPRQNGGAESGGQRSWFRGSAHCGNGA